MFTRWILERTSVIAMMHDDTKHHTTDKTSGQHLTGRAKLYAARMRLQNAADREDALEAVQEVVANLIGSEELAIFKTDRQKAAFWLYWSSGIEARKYPYLDAIREPLLDELFLGRPVFQEDHRQTLLASLPDPVSALVPIRVDGITAAVLVIFRLLPQKERFEALDRKICEEISAHGGRAL